MNAQAKIEADKLAIWNALSKTDPTQTKRFKRAGGFQGTAIKPIWVVKMLTEQFGPCGTGWGMCEPSFQIVAGDNREVLVFCTVAGWYMDDGKPATVYGVGGDKVVTHIKANEQYNRPERWENDDEAFKKAFTDAVNNAFKFVGVGADVHMGLFDDSKYVAHVAAEYEERAAANDPGTDPRREPAPREKLEGPHESKTALRKAVHEIIGKVRAAAAPEEIDALLKAAKPTIAQANHYWPSLIEGDPDIEEDVGLKGCVTLRREQLAEDGIVKGLIESMKRCETRPALQSWIEENGDMVDGLDDADGRKFQMAFELHESALLTVATANA